MKRILLRYLAPIAGLAMLSGCGVKESVEQASGEVERFHHALAAGRLQQIWSEADPQFRQSTKQADFARFMGAIDRKLGKVRSTRQVGWNANATTGGTFVTLNLETSFERGSATEQFVYRKADEGRLALVGYNLQSREMMVN